MANLFEQRQGNVHKMKKLTEVYASPTNLDSLSNYMGETPEGSLLVLLGRNRESDLLSESNWDTALKRLGGESETVEIHRFGHWVCGWFEYLCVKENTKSHELALEIEKEIEDYPVLDEEDWVEREDKEAQQAWKEWYDDKERLEYVRENPDQFTFHGFGDMLECIRGKYFSGYASEFLK